MFTYPCEPKAALNIALDLYDVTEGGPHLLSVTFGIVMVRFVWTAAQ